MISWSTALGVQVKALRQLVGEEVPKPDDAETVWFHPKCNGYFVVPVSARYSDRFELYLITPVQGHADETGGGSPIVMAPSGSPVGPRQLFLPVA